MDRASDCGSGGHTFDSYRARHFNLGVRMGLRAVIEKIEAARLRYSAHHIVKILAVSKYQSVDDVAMLLEQGQRAFGENKVQDLATKQEALGDKPIEWHFIGALQKNKINKLISLSPFMLHSLSSLDLAYAIDKRLKAQNQSLNALLQINASASQSQGGVELEKAKDVFAQIKSQCANIHLQGLMCIGANSSDVGLVRKSFEDTYKIYEDLQDVSVLSMGMSSDYELAIACGSNMVRLGSAIFA